jgi:hypothetical protein
VPDPLPATHLSSWRASAQLCGLSDTERPQCTAASASGPDRAAMLRTAVSSGIARMAVLCVGPDGAAVKVGTRLQALNLRWKSPLQNAALSPANPERGMKVAAPARGPVVRRGCRQAYVGA